MTKPNAAVRDRGVFFGGFFRWRSRARACFTRGLMEESSHETFQRATFVAIGLKHA